MGLITLLLVIALVGVVCWLIVTLIPMPAPFPTIIIGVACILVLLWLIESLGGGGLPSLHFRN